MARDGARLAGSVPEVGGDPSGVQEVLRRAEEAWRAATPDSSAAEALLRHGRRIWEVLRETAGDAPRESRRALAAAAILHEVGRFVRDRGHHAARAARWTAIHLDDILAHASSAERRLVGELILFHRHRGPLPPELSRPDLVAAFQRAEALDRTGGRLPPGHASAALERAEAEWPRGPLRAALRRSDLHERLRHPFLAGRVSRILRPDR